jgi:hydrogenase maturation protease
LVIGYGNSLRRDDGAGLFLAAALAERWLAAGLPVRHLAVHQLVPELAEEIARPEVAAVLFIDAAVAAPQAPQLGGASHGIARVEPLAASPSVGHHLDPALLLLYAERLLGHGPPAWLLTVPGQDFAFGEGFSPAVQAAIGQILDRADAVWCALYVK